MCDEHDRMIFQAMQASGKGHEPVAEIEHLWCCPGSSVQSDPHVLTHPEIAFDHESEKHSRSAHWKWAGMFRPGGG